MRADEIPKWVPNHSFLSSSTQRTPRAPNAFAVFVKENYGYHRTPGRSHADTMKELGAKFSATKISAK